MSEASCTKSTKHSFWSKLKCSVLQFSRFRSLNTSHKVPQIWRCGTLSQTSLSRSLDSILLFRSSMQEENSLQPVESFALEITQKTVCISTQDVNHLFQHDMILILWTAIWYLPISQNVTQCHFGLIQEYAIDMRRHIFQFNTISSRRSSEGKTETNTYIYLLSTAILFKVLAALYTSSSSAVP